MSIVLNSMYEIEGCFEMNDMLVKLIFTLLILSYITIMISDRFNKISDNKE